PREVPVRIGINAYLHDAVSILVEKRSRPLNRSLAEIQKGSMPTDGGNFIVEQEDYAQVMADPAAAKYVHRYVGARQLLRAEDRWCLWLEGMDPADLTRSRILRERVDAVRAFRASSTAASTRDYPHHHLFRQPQRLTERYACIPSVVSEARRYFVVASLEPDVIASNLVFQCSVADGFQFAILSSSMFIAWQK